MSSAIAQKAISVLNQASVQSEANYEVIGVKIIFIFIR